MSISKFSAEDLRKARSAGFKGKKPKKGKLPTMTSMNAYVDRYNDWVKRAKAKVSDHKKKEAEKKKLKDMKSKLRGY